MADLFPDGVPIDPFSGEHFSYERTAEGVRIASERWHEATRTLAPGELEEFGRDTGLLWELPD